MSEFTRGQMRDEIRRRLAGSRSTARHGRAPEDLKAARAALAALLNRFGRQVTASDPTWADVQPACVAHDRACEAAGLPTTPAAGGFLRR